MAIKVKTLYLSNFNIPQSCVACGAPPGVGTTWKVQGSKSDWTGKHTTGLTLELPLCQQCHDVSRDKGSAKILTVLGILVAIGACLFGGNIMSLITDIDIMSIGVGAVLAVAVLFLFRWLGNRASQKGFTSEQRDRRQKVKRCARITGFKEPGSKSDKGGSIQFEFENLAYALEFSNLNLGKISDR